MPDEILDILSPVYPVGGAVAVLEPPRKLAVVPKVVFVGIGFSSFVRLLARDKAFPLLFCDFQVLWFKSFESSFADFCIPVKFSLFFLLPSRTALFLWTHMKSLFFCFF